MRPARLRVKGHLDHLHRTSTSSPPTSPLAQGQLQSLAIGGGPLAELGGPPATALLGALAALSHLTRLTSLTVHAGASLSPQHGGLEGRGSSAWDVLRALPPGAPLKQVGHRARACPQWGE
jgi:hypothetical protein